MKKILIHLESGPKASVFDQIAAYDAGTDNIIAYGGVTPDDVQRKYARQVFLLHDQVLHDHKCKPYRHLQ